MTDFEPESAYPELLALACRMRPDWSLGNLRDAMTAVHSAGWQWRDVYREVMRLAWTQDETPATLRNSARRPVQVPVPTGPDVNARGREAAMAVLEAKLRATGEQSVLTDDDERTA